MKMTVRQVQSSLGSNPDEIDQRASHDFYRTGEPGTRGLLSVEQFSGVVWEPACGKGDMAEVLKSAGLNVISTDLIDRGYGDGLHDFLREPALTCDHVVTNPPYTLAEDFVHRGLEIVPPGGKVAMLCRLAWMEGSGRHKRLFGPTPPARVLAFSSRIPMARGDMTFRTGLIAFAWFVWVKGSYGETRLGWV